MFTRRLAAAGVIAALMLSVTPVFADEGNGTSSPPVEEKHENVNGQKHEQDQNRRKDHGKKDEGMKKPLDPVCLGAALDKRDGAVNAAFDVFVAAFKAAVTARATALKAAWILADASQMQKAVGDARMAFKSANHDARKALHMARKGASQQFKTDRKACGGHGDSGDEEEDGLKL